MALHKQETKTESLPKRYVEHILWPWVVSKPNWWYQQLLSPAYSPAWLLNTAYSFAYAGGKLCQQDGWGWGVSGKSSVFCSFLSAILCFCSYCGLNLISSYEKATLILGKGHCSWPDSFGIASKAKCFVLRYEFCPLRCFLMWEQREAESC